MRKAFRVGERRGVWCALENLFTKETHFAVFSTANREVSCVKKQAKCVSFVNKFSKAHQKDHVVPPQLNAVRI